MWLVEISERDKHMVDLLSVGKSANSCMDPEYDLVSCLLFGAYMCTMTQNVVLTQVYQERILALSQGSAITRK
jgi:hypothetical protein